MANLTLGHLELGCFLQFDRKPFQHAFLMNKSDAAATFTESQKRDIGEEAYFALNLLGLCFRRYVNLGLAEGLLHEITQKILAL